MGSLGRLLTPELRTSGARQKPVHGREDLLSPVHGLPDLRSVAVETVGSPVESHHPPLVGPGRRQRLSHRLCRADQHDPPLCPRHGGVAGRGVAHREVGEVLRPEVVLASQHSGMAGGKLLVHTSGRERRPPSQGYAVDDGAGAIWDVRSSTFCFQVETSARVGGELAAGSSLG